jgi:sugar phosphate permease
MLFFGIGFMLFSQVQDLFSFYASFVLIALGSSLGGYATLMVSLVNWFDRHRTKAISLSQLGYSVGGLCVPLIVIALESFGWRTTAFYSGVFVLIIGLPLVQLVRHRPEDHGQTPDGITIGPDESTITTPGRTGFTAKQAMRTSSFWLISLGHAFALLIVSSVIVHLIPHLTEGSGYTLVQAGQVVMLLTLFQLLGQIAGGPIGDRFNKRWLCAICMVAHTVGLLLVTYLTTWPFIFLFCLLHGFAWGIRGPMMVALRADYFGTRAFGTIMGFSSLVVMFGMSGGPIVAGLMADIYGNYQFGFTLLACSALLGALCFLAATPPQAPVDPDSD